MKGLAILLLIVSLATKVNANYVAMGPSYGPYAAMGAMGAMQREK